MKDIRGNDAYSDSVREGRTEVSIRLRGIIDESLIKQYCDTFENGLISKGIQYANANFLKKFADMQISIDAAKNNTQSLPALLYPPVPKVIDKKAPVPYVPRTIFQTFFATQELYLHRIVEK
jgi:hypothetical protein